MDLDAINARIAEVHKDKKWILTADAAAGATSMVDRLREWESGPLMIVAAIEGVGDVPEVERIYYTRTHGDTVMGGIRAYLKSIENPDAGLLAAVDTFDPDHQAMNLFGAFSREAEFFGRPIYGARPPEWGALEDKMLIDGLCDAAGITRAPSVIVAAAGAADAAGRLATNLGTVWVADNTEGWHGGGEYVRWVRGADEVGPATAWFAEHAETVRVMPFLEGVPCSIHGFNTRDGTAVFLPVELMIFRNAERPEFFYGQAANFWDPPPSIADEMRDAARRMGGLIAGRVGYLGSFGIDGVATSSGFLPTELNPRFSVGHALQATAADVPLSTIERLLIEGDIEIDAIGLEERIVTGTQRSRGGGMLIPLTAKHEAAETGVVFTESRAVAVDIDEENDATMKIGPSAFGSVVIMRLDPERNEIGPRVAPMAIQAIALAEELWGIEVPGLVAAPDPF
jgi:hypothetical protein